MIDTKDKKTRKAEKFFFDVNHFDDDFEEEIEEEEPPPPVFSEDELTAAKDAAYRRGRQEALAEAEASREKQIATLIGVINQQFQTLFEAEDLRSSQYESEAVLVAKAIFKKLFPSLNEKEGLNEVHTVIAEVLEGMRDNQEIIIEIHPDFHDSIEKRLESVTSALPNHNKVTIKPAEDLGAGDCRMSWNDGGAGRDITALTEEIHRKLEHMLADKPSLQDNRGEQDAEDLQHHQDEAEQPAEDIQDDAPEKAQADTNNGDDQ